MFEGVETLLGQSHKRMINDLFALNLWSHAQFWERNTKQELGYLSSGNATLGPQSAPRSLHNFMAQYYTAPSPYGYYVAVANHWFRYLMKMEQFHELVRIRFSEIKDREIIQTIEQLFTTAQRYTVEFNRNFELHQIIGETRWRATDAMNELPSWTICLSG